MDRLTEGMLLDFVAMDAASEKGAWYRTGQRGIERIEVTHERGQMAMIPWAEVTWADGSRSLLNLTYAKAVGPSDGIKRRVTDEDGGEG